MAAMAQLRYSPLSDRHNFPRTLCPTNLPRISISPKSFNLSLSSTIKHSFSERFQLPCSGGTGDIGIGSGGRGGSGGGGSGGDGNYESSSSSSWESFGILGLFIKGWSSRVAADPQFPFKVLMEELVGVSACLLGDMASRPNFGLNELDFVFSTLVVGSIMNFTLMYLLAPTMASSASTLPAIFAGCPISHMFEPGAYTLTHRLGTFVYKGVVFGAAGFAAGLVGTAISNGLVKMRKKMDPTFETPNKPPPTLLNAMTWALHMGLSSNFRYQTLNGIEFVLANALPPVMFKSSVVVLRCLNNVLGGVSFVTLARLTGSQSVAEKKSVVAAAESEMVEEKEKLLNHGDNLPANNRST